MVDGRDSKDRWQDWQGGCLEFTLQLVWFADDALKREL